MEELAAVGIDFDAITARLENEGIDLFVKSYETLIDAVESKRQTVASV